MTTKSFEVEGARVDRIVRAAVSASAGSVAPHAGVLFVSRGLASELPALAAALAAASPSAPWLLAATPGVLSERREHEREPAAVGMIFSKTRTRILLASDSDASFGASVGEELDRGPGSSALVLLRGDELDDSWLVELDRKPERAAGSIFGGGTLPGASLFVIDDSGVRSGNAAALLLQGPTRARVASSAACRLLSPLAPVTKTRGSLLLEIEGDTALSRLGEAAESLDERHLVLLVVAAGDAPLSPRGRSIAVRPIQGVDPSRGGILLADEIPVGARVAFAVRDAHAARADWSAHLRELGRTCAGTAPSFGIYVNCAGRGRGLYQANDVDVRLIREQFPSMPVVGFHSTFELAPLAGRLTPQIYTGVLGVYCSPS